MPTYNFNELTGKQKAAILLMSMDVDVASKVFKELDMSEVEAIALEITNLKDVPANVVEDVIEEFYELMQASSLMLEGGLDYAQVKNKNKKQKEEEQQALDEKRV